MLCHPTTLSGLRDDQDVIVGGTKPAKVLEDRMSFKLMFSGVLSGDGQAEPGN